MPPLIPPPPKKGKQSLFYLGSFEVSTKCSFGSDLLTCSKFPLCGPDLNPESLQPEEGHVVSDGLHPDWEVRTEALQTTHQ